MASGAWAQTGQDVERLIKMVDSALIKQYGTEGTAQETTEKIESREI